MSYGQFYRVSKTITQNYLSSLLGHWFIVTMLTHLKTIISFSSNYYYYFTYCFCAQSPNLHLSVHWLLQITIDNANYLFLRYWSHLPFTNSTFMTSWIMNFLVGCKWIRHRRFTKNAIVSFHAIRITQVLIFLEI